MRKVIAALVALVAAVGLGPTVWAQLRGREVRPPIERMLLQGMGSEIGVSVRELRADEVSNAKQSSGAVVDEVHEGSPGARAGLRSGDVVVEFDGERVRGVRDFSRLVRETPPGRTVKTGVVRKGERLTLDVTPQEGGRLSDLAPYIEREIERGVRAIPRDFELEIPQRISRVRLGVSLAPLTDQLASYFGVREGALVTAVDADSPAARAGLLAGDVITAIAGEPVADPGDVTAAIRRSGSGAAVGIRITRDKKDMTVSATMPDRRRDNRARIPV